MAKDNYDAVIIGGGHNGLVCSFYLAKAGLKVKVLERRNIVGGAAGTEELYFYLINTSTLPTTGISWKPAAETKTFAVSWLTGYSRS